MFQMHGHRKQTHSYRSFQFYPKKKKATKSLSTRRASMRPEAAL